MYFQPCAFRKLLVKKITLPLELTIGLNIKNKSTTKPRIGPKSR